MPMATAAIAAWVRLVTPSLRKTAARWALMVFSDRNREREVSRLVWPLERCRRVGVLQQVAGSSLGRRGLAVVAVVVSGQHDDREVRPRGADLPKQLDTVASWHADVDQRHLMGGLAEYLHGLVGAGGLGHLG